MLRLASPYRLESQGLRPHMLWFFFPLLTITIFLYFFTEDSW